MRREEQVLTNIKHFLNMTDQTNSQQFQDLAESYRGLCIDLNTRLERCNDFMLKGLRGEAISFAENEPPVIEMARELNFANKTDWLDICKLYDWPEPPELRMDIVEKLKAAYMEHSALKPLIDKYRAKSRTGTNEEKVRLLRQISALDNGAKLWKDNLLQIEPLWIEELISEARNAIEAKDMEKLTVLHLVLSSPDWSSKIDQRVLDKIDTELKQWHINQLTAKGNRLAKRIWKCYEAMDHEALQDFANQWEKLNADPYFHPDKAQLEQVQEASEWLESKLNLKLKEIEFESLKANLSKLLDEHVWNSQLDNTYNQLRGYGWELPELLETRYHNVLEERAIDATRHHKQKLAIIGMSFFIFAVGSGIVLYMHQKAVTYKNWSTQIDNAFKNTDVEGLHQLLDGLEKTHPEMATLPEMLTKKENAEKLFAEYDIKKRRAKELFVLLRDAKKSGFSNFPQAGKFIDELEAFPCTTDEKKELSEIKDAKEANDLEIMQQAERKFKEKSKRIQQLFDILLEMDPDDSVKKYAASLSSVAIELENLRQIPDVAKEFKEGMEKVLEERFYSCQRNLKDAEERLASRDCDLLKLYEKLSPVSEYKKNIAEFISRHPKDPLSENLKKVTNLLSAYENAVLLSTFDFSSLSKPERFTDALLIQSRLSGKDNVWGNALGDFLKYYKATIEGQKLLEDQILRWSEDKMIYDLKDVVFKSTDGKIFHNYAVEEMTVRYPNIDMKKLKSIRELGENYHLEDQGKGKGWKIDGEKKKMILISEDKKTFKAAHSIFFKKLKESVKFANPDEYESLLIDKLLELSQDETFNPVIAVLFSSKLLEILKKISFADSDSYDNILEKMSELRKKISDVDWVQIDDAGYLIKIKGELRKMRTVLEDKQKINPFKKEIVMTGLGRKVDIVGRVCDISGAKRFSLRPLSERSLELWTLVKRDNVLHFTIVATRKTPDLQFEKLNNIDEVLFEGQLLFSPSDGMFTSSLSKKIADNADKAGIKVLDWPPYWPKNSFGGNQ